MKIQSPGDLIAGRNGQPPTDLRSVKQAPHRTDEMKW
jgi:hypothetical protein